MASGCMYSHSALGCVDGRAAPLRATYMNLYGRPESDAEFVKAVSNGEQLQWSSAQRRRRCRFQPDHPLVVDSFSCRQMYLRSYTFSKKESLPERTRKCLGKVKEKAVGVAANGKGAVSGCVPWMGSGSAAAGDRSVRAIPSDSGGSVRKKAQKKLNRCLMVTRLKEVSTTAFRSLFRRLFFCTTSIDLADRQPS